MNIKKRFYFALTNCCNRTCKYCSCYSRPGKNTFLPFEKIKEYIDSVGDNCDFEIQLEGGEPLLHPDFYNIIEYAVNTGKCDAVILTSNFVLVNDVEEFFDKINVKNLNRFLIKPSINFELYEDGFFEKMKTIRDLIKSYPKFDLKFNVRLDKTENDDFILENLERFHLVEDSNIFYYQRYGYAKNNESFDLPFIISNPVDFHLISPDGIDFGMDLISRSNHMEKLP